MRQNRDEATQSLCFNSRPFVLCGLPVRRLPNDQLLYERRNWRFVLQDRPVPIFLASLAAQQRSAVSWHSTTELLPPGTTISLHHPARAHVRRKRAEVIHSPSTDHRGTTSSPELSRESKPIPRAPSLNGTPSVVTACTRYATAAGQSCPADLKTTGGPGRCSCEAQPKSKDVLGPGGAVRSWFRAGVIQW